MSARQRLLDALRNGGVPTAPPVWPPVGTASPTQRRFRAFDLRWPGTGVHNLATAFRFDGGVDPDRVRAALHTVLTQVEVLRTSVDDRGHLVLHPADDVRVTVHAAAVDPDSQLADLAAEPFPPGALPLRAHLVVGAGETRLGLVAHHGVVDGASLPHVLRALSAAWDGRPLALAPVTHAMAVGHLDRTVDPEGQRWWRERLAGAPDPPFALGAGGFRARELRVGLGPVPATPAVADLLALFAVAVGRSTGARSLRIGVPASLRTAAAALEDVIGPLVDTVVTRVDLDDGSTMADLAERLHRELRDALSHLGTPIEAQLGADPLQLLFGYRDARAERLRLGVDGHPLPLARRWAEVPLAFDVELRDDGLFGTLRWREDRVGEALAHRVCRDLARGWAEPRSTSVGALLAPTPHERAELAAVETGSPLPERLPDPVDALFDAVARHPDRPAVRTVDETLSYRALGERVEALAGAIGNPAGPVAIVARRSPELVIALWAALRAGVPYVPLDPAAPAERNAAVVEEARPAVVVGDETARALAERIGARHVPVSARGPALPPTRPDPAGAAYVLFTSGSTGRPKGVVVERRNLSQFLAAMDGPLAGPPGVWLAVTSPSFDIAVLELLWTVTRGYTVAMAPELRRSDRGPDATDATLGEVARALAPTHLQCTPSLARILGQDPAFREAAAGVVRWVLGGERCTAAVLDEIARYCPAAILNAYGPTETTVWSTVFPVVDRVDPIPIGRPLAGTRVRVADDRGRPVAPGAPGELWIGGRGVARGYLNRPELDRERFVVDPDGGRWYRTGDRVRWSDRGQLEYLGRSDDQVKVRGHRIELGEIEAVVARLPGVTGVAVAPREGPSGLELHAHVSGPADLGALPALARAYLPPEMIPSRWWFEPELPLLPSGKVDRKRLVAPADPPDEPHPPPSDLEALVGDAFAAALGRPIARTRSLFDEGGHSLAAVEIAGALRRRAPALPLDAVFRAPTIAGLAAVIAPLLAEPPAPAAPPDEGRASFGQEQLWLLERLAPAAYNHEVLLVADGRVARAPIERALERVVARHEVLRTAFVDRAGSVVPVVAASAAVSVRARHVAGESELVDRAAEELARPFALDRAPLLRATWFEWTEPDGAPRTALLLVVHHLVWDAASAAILARELTDDCDRPTQVRYAPFAARQRARFDGSGAEPSITWFRGALPPVEPLSLPFDRTGNLGANPAAGAVPIRIGPDAVDALRHLARASGTTLFVTVLALFQAWLGAQTGQPDVRVAVPVANRGDPDTRDLIGYLVNTVVTRGDLSGAPSFRTLIARAAAHWRDVLAHHELPFPRLVQALAPERTARAPLAQAMLVFQEDPHPTLTLGGTPTRRVRVPPRFARFDATWTLEPDDGGLTGFLSYPAAGVAPGTPERWARQLQRLLDHALAAPDTPLRELRVDPPRVEPAEIEAPTERMEQRVCAVAARFPDAIAVIDGPDTLTYRELVTRAARIGAALSAAGAGPDRPVWVTESRGTMFALAFLGAWFAGAAASGLSPGAPDEHRKQIAEVLRPGAVVGPGGTSIAALESSGAAVPSAGPRDELCYVAFTSGSTGRPKGIEQLHRSFLQFLDWQASALRLEVGRRVAVWSPLHYDASYCELFGAWVTGATACFAPARHSPLDTARWVAHTGIHWFQTVPSFLGPWLDATADDELPHLSVVTVSGEVLPADLARRWWRRFGDRVALVNLYGPSETVLATAHPVRLPDEGDRVPIGHPIAGRKIRLADPEGREVPEGAVGEILIETRFAARGYRDLPDETVHRFGPPTERRVVRTGDRGRVRPDGALEFLGRIDRMVKVRGHRIDLAEIESVAAELPSLTGCVARVVSDPPILVLWVEGVDEVTARAHLSRRLPVERVPGRIVELPRLPRGSTGKVDPSALVLPAAAPTGPIRGGTEAAIARAWADVLGRDTFGRDENFFDAGGDSLALARVHDHLRSVRYGDLALVDLFRFPTVAALARHLDRSPGPVDRPDPTPPAGERHERHERHERMAALRRRRSEPGGTT